MGQRSLALPAMEWFLVWRQMGATLTTFTIFRAAQMAHIRKKEFVPRELSSRPQFDRV